MNYVHAIQGTVLLLCFGAAITDGWKGTIPNALTFPGILLGVLLQTLGFGLQGFASALLGIFACGLVPYFLFRRGAFGGGDVKLLGAIGSLLGIRQGLEVQILALVAATLYALAKLAWRGGLFRTLANAAHLLVAPLLPKARRAEMSADNMHTVRFGGAALVAAALHLFVLQGTLL